MPEAIQCLERSIEILPYFHEAKVDLAIVLSSLGKGSEAKDLAYAVLQEDAKHPRAQALFQQMKAWN